MNKIFEKIFQNINYFAAAAIVAIGYTVFMAFTAQITGADHIYKLVCACAGAILGFAAGINK